MQLWSCAAIASLVVGNGSYDMFALLLQAHSTGCATGTFSAANLAELPCQAGSALTV